MANCGVTEELRHAGAPRDEIGGEHRALVVERWSERELIETP